MNNEHERIDFIIASDSILEKWNIAMNDGVLPSEDELNTLLELCMNGIEFDTTVTMEKCIRHMRAIPGKWIVSLVLKVGQPVTRSMIQDFIPHWEKFTRVLEVIINRWEAERVAQSKCTDYMAARSDLTEHIQQMEQSLARLRDEIQSLEMKHQGEYHMCMCDTAAATAEVYEVAPWLNPENESNEIQQPPKSYRIHQLLSMHKAHRDMFLRDLSSGRTGVIRNDYGVLLYLDDVKNKVPAVAYEDASVYKAGMHLLEIFECDRINYMVFGKHVICDLQDNAPDDGELEEVILFNMYTHPVYERNLKFEVIVKSETPDRHRELITEILANRKVCDV